MPKPTTQHRLLPSYLPEYEMVRRRWRDHWRDIHVMGECDAAARGPRARATVGLSAAEIADSGASLAPSAAQSDPGPPNPRAPDLHAPAGAAPA